MSAVGLFLKAYWREIAAAALLAFAVWRGYGWAYGHGQRDERLGWVARENKALESAIDEKDKAIAARNEAQAKADKLAAHPPKVIERVRQNPSGCTVPKPVADGLREQVAEINRAIREGGVRGDPVAPRD
jgi:hypothetical protein